MNTTGVSIILREANELDHLPKHRQGVDKGSSSSQWLPTLQHSALLLFRIQCFQSCKLPFSAVKHLFSLQLSALAHLIVLWRKLRSTYMSIS